MLTLKLIAFHLLDMIFSGQLLVLLMNDLQIAIGALCRLCAPPSLRVSVRRVLQGELCNRKGP